MHNIEIGLKVNEDGQFVVMIKDAFETRTHTLSRAESREKSEALLKAQAPTPPKAA